MGKGKLYHVQAIQCHLVERIGVFEHVIVFRKIAVHLLQQLDNSILGRAHDLTFWVKDLIDLLLKHLVPSIQYRKVVLNSGNVFLGGFIVAIAQIDFSIDQ